MLAAVVAGTLIGGLVVVTLPRLPTSPAAIRTPWWLLAVAFACCEVWRFPIRLRHYRAAVSLGGLPLVVGLFALTPGWLLVARLVGAVLVLAVLRARTLPRAVHGLTLAGLQAALACATMGVLAGGHGVFTAQSWCAALVATAVTEMLDGFVLRATAGGRWRWWRWSGRRTGWAGHRSDSGEEPNGSDGLARSLAGALVVALVGLLLATVLALGPGVVLPAVPCLLAAALGYRLHLLLLERAEGHQRLLRFGERLREAGDVDGVARLVVAHVADLVRASRVEVVIGYRGRCVAWVAGLLATPVHSLPPETSPGPATVVDDGEAVLAAVTRFRLRRTGDPTVDHLLRSRNLHQAVVLPLGAGEQMAGALLIGDRVLTVARGYTDREIDLLRTVADQATLALRHVDALERLRHEATHDQLTGLPNRQQFRRQAVQAVIEAAELGSPCAVGVLDLDGFRTVNSSLGHLAGDAVLAEVGRRMAALNRDGLQVSRLGGDEFAVLVCGVRDEAEAVARTRQLLDGLHAPFEVMGDQVRLTGSLGLALAPRDGATPEQLLRSADVAMSAAKEEAGGIRTYSRELTEMLDAPLSLAADLRLALARGDVTIAVQPLVDLATGRLHSVEALARWRHPVLGAVNPEAFVTAAERVGLVGELTGVVIEQALMACQSWLACGLEVQVAVNLAARTLSDPELAADVEAALHRYGVPGRLFCFELTETGVISSPDRALEVLSRLRELGVRLAVDDFGTGYSSMTYMNWLAPDQVKIDKSFVQRLRFDPRNEAIVRSIIDLAHNLGVDVVAEGVGDAGTATHLADLGCTIGQGFLFAEPMPPSDLPDWVARWMHVPEREELPEAEADPLVRDDVVMMLGSGSTMGVPAAVAAATTGPVPVLTGPTGGSVASATGPAGPAGGTRGGPRGDDSGEGEVRLHIVR